MADPGSAQLKLHLDPKPNIGRSNVVQKTDDIQAGLCSTVSIYKDNLATLASRAGGFILWLIAAVVQTMEKHTVQGDRKCSLWQS